MCSDYQSIFCSGLFRVWLCSFGFPLGVLFFCFPLVGETHLGITVRRRIVVVTCGVDSRPITIVNQILFSVLFFVLRGFFSSRLPLPLQRGFSFWCGAQPIVGSSLYVWLFSSSGALERLWIESFCVWWNHLSVSSVCVLRLGAIVKSRRNNLLPPQTYSDKWNLWSIPWGHRFEVIRCATVPNCCPGKNKNNPSLYIKICGVLRHFFLIQSPFQCSPAAKNPNCFLCWLTVTQFRKDIK